MGSSIIVTGGNGFIGSHVVEALKTAGHQPIVLTRRQPARGESSNYVLGDICDYQVVAEAIARSDGVIHLAGTLGTVESLSDPASFVRTNILGSLNVFDACKFYKKRCIYAGVGNPGENNTYAISKHTTERFALMYNKEHKTDIVPIRVFNVYGERQKPEPIKKLVPAAIAAALKSEPITVFGDGEQKNDFIYVKDVADSLIKALWQDFDRTKVYDLGTCVGTPVKEVVENILRISRSSSRMLIKGTRRPGEDARLLVAEKKNLLDPHAAFTPLSVGLQKTIAAAAEVLAA